MKWKRLGLIFDPAQHKTLSGFAGYAQSPQAIVLADRIRIFFSIRKQDGTKMVSHVSYVDFSKDMGRILDVQGKPVIEPGALGAFDEHGIFPLSPLLHDGRLIAYTTGWSRRVSVSVETSIGLVKSDDEGKTFYREGVGPVLSSSLHEPFLVGDGFVRHHDGQYHMWYIYGTRWEVFEGNTEPDRVYKIAHAVSQDGRHFSHDSKCIIPDRIGDTECQALPSVLSVDNQHSMVFCYRHASGFRTDPSKGYRLGWATSTDLHSWVRNDSMVDDLTLSREAWDSEMICYPHLFECEENVYLLYNGNTFGKGGFGAARLER